MGSQNPTSRIERLRTRMQAEGGEVATVSAGSDRLERLRARIERERDRPSLRSVVRRGIDAIRDIDLPDIDLPSVSTPSPLLAELRGRSAMDRLKLAPRARYAHEEPPGLHVPARPVGEMPPGTTPAIPRARTDVDEHAPEIMYYLSRLRSPAMAELTLNLLIEQGYPRPLPNGETDILPVSPEQASVWREGSERLRALRQAGRTNEEILAASQAFAAEATPALDPDRLAERGIVGEAAAGMARGVGQIIEGVGGVAQGPLARLLERLPQVRQRRDLLTTPEVEPTGPLRPDRLRAAGAALTERGRGVQQDPRLARSEAASETFEPGNVRWWVAGLSEIAPQYVAQIGLALATGGAGALTRLAAFAAPTAVLEGGLAYNRARDQFEAQGDDPVTADRKASGVSVLTAVGATALEAIPGSVLLFKRFPGARRVFQQGLAKRIVGYGVANALAEGGTEAAQEAWADVIAYASKSDPAAFSDWVQRYAAAGALGTVAGGTAGTVEGAFSRPAPAVVDPADLPPDARPDPVPPPTTEELAVPERVTGSATRVAGKYDFVGGPMENHGDVRNRIKAVTTPIDFQLLPFEDGFWTSHGRFVSRQEAKRIEEARGTAPPFSVGPQGEAQMVSPRRQQAAPELVAEPAPQAEPATLPYDLERLARFRARVLGPNRGIPDDLDLLQIGGEMGRLSKADRARVRKREQEIRQAEEAEVAAPPGVAPSDVLPTQAQAVERKLAPFGIILTADIARKGLALANLPQKLFDDVVTKRIGLERGVRIGESGLTEAQQLELVRAIEKRGTRLRDDEMEQLIRQVKSAGEVQVSQESLFGEETFARSLFVEKAQLAAAVARELAESGRGARAVAKAGRAERLETAGVATVDVDRAKEVAEQSAQAVELFNRLSSRAGPISDALNRAAERLARGESRSAIETELLAEVERAIETEAAALPSADRGGEGRRGEGTEGTGAEGPAPAAEEVRPEPPPSPLDDEYFRRKTPSGRGYVSRVPETETVTLDGVTISPDDVQWDTAVAAFEGTSHSPEERADRVRHDYVATMRDVHKLLAGLTNDEAVIRGDLERFREGYLRKLHAYLASRRGLVSSFIAGSSKFPARQMEKRHNTVQRRLDELIEWEKRARAAITRAHSEPGTGGPISSDDPDAPAQLRTKIEEREAFHENMKAANAVIRKKQPEAGRDEQLRALGFDERTIRNITRPDFAGRLGFPDYALKNNMSEIKRLRARVESLEQARAQETRETVFDGGRMIENVEDNRLQLFFDSKPDEATRKRLKASGFKWAPNAGAWQRQLTENARIAARQIVGDDLPGTMSVGEAVPSYAAGLSTVVVDEDGRAKRVFHGTSASFESFNEFATDDHALFGPGFYFTEDPEVAGGPGAGRVRRGYTVDEVEGGYQVRQPLKGGGFLELSMVRPTREEAITESAQFSLGYAGKGSAPRFLNVSRGPGATMDEVRAFYTPGRIVPSYGGQDLVLSFNEGGDRGWRVTVIAVSKAGEELPGELPRTHYTSPTHDKLVASGIRQEQSAANVRPARLVVENPLDIDRRYTAREAYEIFSDLGIADEVVEPPPIDDDDVAAVHLWKRTGTWTGEEIYAELVSFYGDKAEANHALRDGGFDSITHIGGSRVGHHEHRVWIVFDRARIRSAFGPFETAQQVGERTPDYAQQSDLFVAPTEIGSPQQELFQESLEGLSASQRKAFDTLRRLRAIVHTEQATAAQREEYRLAMALLKRDAKISMDELRAGAQPGNVTDPGTLPLLEMAPEWVQDEIDTAFSTVGEAARAADVIAQLQLQLQVGESSAVELPGLPTFAERRERMRAVRARRSFIQARGIRITSVEDAYRAMSVIRDPRMEHQLVQFLDTDGTVLGQMIWSSGVINTVVIGDMLDLALEVRLVQQALGADRVILAHNHPAGDPTPSTFDKVFAVWVSRIFREVGIKVGGLYVIDNGEMSQIHPDPDIVDGLGDPTVQALIQAQPELAATTTLHDLPAVKAADDWVTSRISIESALTLIHPEPERFDVLYLNGRHTIITVEPHRKRAAVTFGKWLPERTKALAGYRAIIVTGDEATFDAIRFEAAGDRDKHYTVLDVLLVRPGHPTQSAVRNHAQWNPDVEAHARFAAAPNAVRLAEAPPRYGAEGPHEVGEEAAPDRAGHAQVPGLLNRPTEAEAVAHKTPGLLRFIPGGLRSFLQRNITSRGHLPGPVFHEKVIRDGRLGSMESQIRFTLADFQRAGRKVYGRNIPEAERLKLDAALKGEVPIESVPEPFQGIVQTMRAQIDALSYRMIEAGIVEGELAARVADNFGVYATRSYRAFDDPDWAKKVPPHVRNRAKGLLRQEFPEKSDGEIEGLINELLYRREDGPVALLTQGKLGSKDLSSLHRRKDIHPIIRELMGEYRDPVINYARSITRLGYLVENHRFLEEVRRLGVGSAPGELALSPEGFLFTEPVVIGDVSYHTQIAAEGSRVLEPLNGLYTSPEIARAFRDAVERDAVPDWLRIYMKANGTVKFSKTVLSLMTNVRNVLGNTGFAVANGHWRLARMRGAWRATLTRLGKLDDTAWRTYYRHLQELGVVGESARAGELRDVIRDASEKEPDEVVGSFRRGIRKLGELATEVYRAEDDIWKVFAFENEKARYMEAWKGRPVSEIERRAAEIVWSTYPTYSLVPRGIRLLRRFPLVGTFVSFPAEVYRTGYNTIALIRQELADPRTKRIGSERLAGSIMAALSVTAIGAATRAITGMGDDEEDDLRRFLPPWSVNSSLLLLGRDENGNVRFIDLSYTDPHSYLRKPLIAFLRGDDWERALIGATVEAASPFLGEELLAGKLLDLTRNRTRQGREVWNPASPPDERAREIAGHLWEAIEPGTLSSFERIVRGLSGLPLQSGRVYDPGVEAVATFTGVRVSTVDVPQSLSFRLRDHAKRIADAERGLRFAVASRSSTVDDVRGAHHDTDRARRRAFAEAHEDVMAAIRLGTSRSQAARLAAIMGSRADAEAVFAGRYVPYMPGEQFWASIEIPMAERRARARALARLLRQGGTR